MILNVKNALKNQGELFPLDIDLELPTVDYQGQVVFLSPVRVRAAYCCMEDNIELRGEVQARLGLICARCNQTFERDMVAELDEHFSHQSTDDMQPISANDTIELDICVQNSILMSLELLRICRPDCKGLCPVCGINRNEALCSCSQSKPEKDNPFAALQGLLNDEEV